MVETKHEALASPDGKILTVKELLSDKSLSIPLYQRPYKWTEKNVNQLFNDIVTHKNKSSYRLGTIVFHDEEGKKNIVDGQQRIITLILAIRALSTRSEENLKYKELKEHLKFLKDNMISPSFKNEISITNIHKNYREILRIVERSDFTEEHIDFLLHKCEVVTFTLKDISEAFQFFDSQNARGRDLEPHDLLKAYHLREFYSGDEQLKATTVAKWEDSETEELATLFSQYLYRIRSWSRGDSARYFDKKDIGLFKGVNMETVAPYPYVGQLRMAHYYIDHYNQQYDRKIDGHALAFPFYLDQFIINGRRFFEMIAHYQEVINNYNKCASPCLQPSASGKLDGYADKILETLNSYEGRNRTGDRYVRTMFDCLLIYYIDKFGFVEISRAIEKIFIWSFSLRLKMQAVRLASVDNYVLKNNLFKLIKDANKPVDFINCTLPVIQKNLANAEKIETLFKAMNYYE